MFSLDLGCDSLNGYIADMQSCFFRDDVPESYFFLHPCFSCVALKVLEQQKHQAEDKMMALEQVCDMRRWASTIRTI